MTEETIALSSPDDWNWRPNFQPEIHAPHDALERIIGKYDLPRPPSGSKHGEGMVSCGLNNCHRKHFTGFLIRLKDGRETIIGQDCGAREFNTSWKDVEAVFRAQERRQAARQVIDSLKEKRGQYVAQAKLLETQCERLHEAINAVRGEFRRFQGFWSHLQSVSRQDGRVLAEIDDGGESKRRTGKVNIGVVANINECGLLLEDTTRYHRALRFKVIGWLESEFEAEVTAAGEDLKKLAAITKAASDLEPHITQAEAFITKAETLLAPSNLAQLSAIETHLLGRSQRSSALSRALRRLSASTPE